MRPVTAYECSSTTEPPVRRPSRRLPLVAFEHADIVQRRAAARPEERGPVWPAPARSSHSRCTTNGGAVPSARSAARQSSFPRPGEFVDDALQAGHIGGQAPRRPQSRLVPEDRSAPESRGSVVTAVTDDAGVEPDAARLQVFAQRIPQGHIEVGVCDVEDQPLAGAKEVDVEHGRQLGGGQVGRFGEEAAGEHLERQMPCGLGEVDVTQEACRRRDGRAARRCRAPTPRPAARPRAR